MFNEKTFTDVWQGKYMPRTNTLTYDILFEIFKMWMHWALNRLFSKRYVYLSEKKGL